MEPVASTWRVGAHPPEETSILRGGPESAGLRKRMERPARVGRLVLSLLGVVTSSAGVALWTTSGSVLGLAFAAFGGFLLALGVVQHLLHRRDMAHWPEQALLWSEGLELVLHNGEVRGASWSDRDLALQLVARRAPPPAIREYLLVWLMDSKVPPVEISAEGFEAICRSAANHHLKIMQGRRGPRVEGTHLVEIRQASPSRTAPLPSPTNSWDPPMDP